MEYRTRFVYKKKFIRKYFYIGQNLKKVLYLSQKKMTKKRFKKLVIILLPFPVHVVVIVPIRTIL